MFRLLIKIPGKQILALVFFLTGVCSLFAQVNHAARYEINAKRIGVDMGGKDALPRSREFIRLDSTYYVGWLFEGVYKFSRSADFLGYKHAIPPLEKALSLLEKDFDDRITHLYSSINYYQQNMQILNDLIQLHYILGRCYNNVETPEKTMLLLQKMESYHLQKDFLGTYTDMAWLYHRNRFFDASKYPFLKNSIAENEEMAFLCCYKQIEHIKKNKAINEQWYGPGQDRQDLLTVYHYLALLHNYNQNYDSSQYYYNLLIQGDRVSWGNYANMKHETVNLDEAAFYYKKFENAGSDALRESNYYLPTLYTYDAKPKEGIALSRQTIAQRGSTPGFGWYNIALARSYLYDGQLDSCDFFLTKASNFKEVHIGTTLTQSQYEFTINLLRIQLLDKRAALIKFYNSGWWYSPGDLLSMLSLKLEKLLLEYALANALAYNPERKRIVYDLFCAEATVSYDESFYLLKNFNLNYFKQKYDLYSATDPRERAHRYFDLFVAKFDYLNGNEEKAEGICKKLLDETVNDPNSAGNPKNAFEYQHEKLFLARVYEILALQNEETNKIEYQNRLYEEYPQLIPFSGLRMKMSLQVEGAGDDLTKEVVKDLKDCSIDFVENGQDVPQASIRFTKMEKYYQAVINVTAANGRQIVTNSQTMFKAANNTGKELVLRLFDKGGAVMFDEPPVAVVQAKK